MQINEVLKDISQKNASDVFIVAGRPLCYKNNEAFYDYSDEVLMPEITKELISDIYRLANGRDFGRVMELGDDDFSFSIRDFARFRVNIYRQRGSLAAVIRIIKFQLPDPAELSIHEEVLRQVDRKKGLILVTGASGCGKSTTLACMIDRVNEREHGHIVTLEDPIEYLFTHKNCIVSQREIALDTKSYATALRAVLRQSPDVILIGEMRDAETIEIAMTASETGHIVISTLHTIGAANTIDRIIDMFPANKQAQARLQLSMVLQAVISQQLVQTVNGDIIPVFEIMTATGAIRNMIRESKTHQIDSVILAGADKGMITMDTSLINMYRKGIITKETAIAKSVSPETMLSKLEAES